MMQSALSIRSWGMLSGMSMISCTTVPQFSSRSFSFLSSAWSGRDEREGQENGEDLLHERRLLCYEVPIVYDEMARVAESASQSQIAESAPCSDSLELRRRELPQAFEYTFMHWLLPIEEL